MTKKSESGQILVLVIAALGVVLFTVLFIIGGAQIYFQNALYSVNSEKVLFLAEAGVDKALASLNATGGSYNGETETTLGDGTYSIVITSQDSGDKLIQATGYIPNKVKAKAHKTIKITATRGVGVAFHYGIQVGDGGLTLGNENTINGSIYSNGTIATLQGGNNNNITGDVWVAGGPQGSPDQQTDCTEGTGNCQDFIFGKVVNGNSQLDIAQSFQPATSGSLNKISLKVYKVGSPPDITVRIMGDKDGKPDKNNVLTTGTLYRDLVAQGVPGQNPPPYGWIDVTFNTLPELTADTSYWIMVDTGADSNNYWAWQKDLAQSYTRGYPIWSPNWSTGNPTWTSFNEDLSFKTIMGGGTTAITATGNFTVGGSVHANTISGLTIAKDAYFQTISDSTVGGQSYPGSSDPPPKVFPISDANILYWQDQADGDGSNTRGPVDSCLSPLGPVKVEGDVTFNSGCDVIIKSPVWITGNLTINSNNRLKLDSSFGGAAGAIVVDGTVEIGSNNRLEGTGTGSSILMILSTYDTQSHGGVSAIVVKNTGNSGVFYASKGMIEPGNGNTYKELTAWGIKLINQSTIDYQTGLSSTLFSSGPSGAYSLVKGTYQVK